MLEFKLVSYPIKVSWTFLLLAVLLLNARFGAIGIALWLAVAFISILLHELAHGVAVRRLGGLVDHIKIYGLGGLTFWNAKYGSIMDWRSRIVVSAAGPLSGLVLGTATFMAVRAGFLGPTMQSVVITPWRVSLGLWASQAQWFPFAVAAFIWISFVWGLFNLLPIGGLDGAQILGQILERRRRGEGFTQAAWVGVILASVGAVYSYFRVSTLLAFIMVMYAINDYARVNDQPPPFGRR